MTLTLKKYQCRCGESYDKYDQCWHCCGKPPWVTETCPTCGKTYTDITRNDKTRAEDCCKGKKKK